MSDKLPAQRVIEAARKWMEPEYDGEPEGEELIEAIEDYEASDDPGVVVSAGEAEDYADYLDRIADDMSDEGLSDTLREDAESMRARVRAALGAKR